MTVFARLLADVGLLWLSHWLWRTGKAERRAALEMRSDIRELTADDVSTRD